MTPSSPNLYLPVCFNRPQTGVPISTSTDGTRSHHLPATDSGVVGVSITAAIGRGSYLAPRVVSTSRRETDDTLGQAGYYSGDYARVSHRLNQGTTRRELTLDAAWGEASQVYASRLVLASPRAYTGTPGQATG